MAISAKGKRQICIAGRRYWWFVRPDGDFMQPTVIVLAMNKRFGIAYKLGQGNVSHWSPKWVPTAEVFGKLHRPQGSQIVARRPNGIQVITTPVWNDDMRITPAFVRRLVEWALSEQER